MRELARRQAPPALLPAVFKVFYEKFPNFTPTEVFAAEDAVLEQMKKKRALEEKAKKEQQEQEAREALERQKQ